MNYGAAELEIVERINDFIASPEIDKAAIYEADLQPETEAEYRQFIAKFTKSRVAVQFVESFYDPSKSVDIVVQEEAVRFRLTFEARKLRGEGGVYNLIELSKKALLGYRITDCDRLTMVKYGFLQYEGDVFQMFLEFECKTINVQLNDDNTEPAIGGLFTELKTNLQVQP